MRAQLRIFAVLLVSIAVAACGDDDDAAPSADAAPGGADAAAGDVDASGTGATCGGFANAQCEAGLWCDFGSNLCGGEDGIGECRTAPEGCTDQFDPVCGCDGEVYSNECEAQAGLTDVSSFGQCEPPEGQFSCGFRFCDEATYCQRGVSDVVGLPDDYSCLPLPAGCGDAPDCGCLAAQNCGDACTADDAGNLTLTCPGG